MGAAVNELSRMFREQYILAIPVLQVFKLVGRNFDGNHPLGKLESINRSVRVAIALQRPYCTCCGHHHNVYVDAECTRNTACGCDYLERPTVLLGACRVSGNLLVSPNVLRR